MHRWQNVFHKTEINLGSRRISMEFYLSTKVLWPWFLQKKKTHKKNLSTILRLLWNMAYVSDAGLSQTFSPHTPQGITQRDWTWLYLGQIGKTAGLGVWSLLFIDMDCRSLRVFYSLSMCCLISPYWFCKLIQLRLGREYDFWTPAALRFSLEISYAGSY